MADTVLNFPDVRLVFPEDTPVDVIRGAIAEHAKTPEARQSALMEWGDQHVARERAAGGTMQTVSDTIRNLARGTAVGSWLDEANASTASVTGQAPYDEALAYQQATDRAVDQGTGAIGTGTKIAGGVGSAVVTPLVRIAQGASMLPQMGNLALNGGLWGGVYGAGEGNSLIERGTNALQGTGIGVGLGAVTAPIARGAGNALGFLADKFKGVPAALSPFHRGAVDRVTRAAQDDVPNISNLPGLAGQYGPEGMIGDVGRNLQGQLGAVARTPGAGQRIALDAVNNRADGAAGRIRADTNAALGPEINLPAARDAIETAASNQARPLYDQFRQTPITYTRELEDIVDVLRNEPSVLRDARRMANLDAASGQRQFFANIANDGTVTVERVPNAAEWDYIKRALDGLAFSNSATRNDRRVYGGIAERIRGTIDHQLSPGAPEQSIWAQARGVSGDGTRITQAMDEGRTAFSKGISPDEMQATRGAYNQPEQLAYTLGARQNVRDAMGNAGTKWGANDDAAARRMLGTDYARQKLVQLAGPQNAQRLTGRLDAETAFDSTREAARGNSITAAATAAQKEFPNAVDKTAASREIGSQSLTGLTLRGLRAVTDALTGGAISERRAAIAADAARILTAQGTSRDDIARALARYSMSRGVTQAGRDAVTDLVSVLGTSATPATVENRGAFAERFAK